MPTPPTPRTPIRAPPSLHPPIPSSLFIQTIRPPTIRSIAISPPRMRGSRCANKFLAACFAFALFAVFREIDAVCCAVGVGGRAGIGFHEEEGHLGVYGVFFEIWVGDGGGGGAGVGAGVVVHLGGCGWVHVLDEVGVVGWVGKEVGGVGFLFYTHDAPVGPEEEDGVG